MLLVFVSLKNMEKLDEAWNQCKGMAVNILVLLRHLQHYHTRHT